MGALPMTSLLEETPKASYECQMCGKNSRKNKFILRSWFSDNEMIVCRDCAYREIFGTKNIKKAKAERILEEKEINQ